MSDKLVDAEHVIADSSQVNAIANEPSSEKQESLSRMMYLLTLRRQNELLAQSKEGIAEIQEKGRKVSQVNAASQAINACESGALDLTNNLELQEALKKAKDAGADIKLDKMKYTPEERNRLLENLRTTTDTLNMQTQTEMQSANLLSQVFDCWTAARPLIKTEHDMMLSCIKKWN